MGNVIKRQRYLYEARLDDMTRQVTSRKYIYVIEAEIHVIVKFYAGTLNTINKLEHTHTHTDTDNSDKCST